jgi:hypothetical protein
MYEHEHIRLKGSVLRSDKRKCLRSQESLMRRHALDQRRGSRNPGGERARAFMEAKQEAMEAGLGSDDDSDDGVEEAGGAAAKSRVWKAVPTGSMHAFRAMQMQLNSNISVDGDQIAAAAVAHIKRIEPPVQIGENLKLLRRQGRPGVVLASGHHVMLDDGEVCLFVAAISTAQNEPAAIVIPLEQHGPPTNSKRKRSGTRHPGAGLLWLQRCPLTEVKAVLASRITFRVHVVPAFTINEDGIGDDGFLLDHGIFNYSALRSEEAPDSA